MYYVLYKLLYVCIHACFHVWNKVIVYKLPLKLVTIIILVHVGLHPCENTNVLEMKNSSTLFYPPFSRSVDQRKYDVVC